MQAMQMALPLLALPWMARVLGPDEFGLLMYSCLIPPLTALFMDWGLAAGGARAAALARGQTDILGGILGAVLSAKIILGCICCLVCMAAWFGLKHSLLSPVPYILAVLLGMIRGMSPVWFFQGAGYGMPYMALCDIGSSICALILIFCLIRGPGEWPLYFLILLVAKMAVYGWQTGRLCLRYNPVISLSAGVAAIRNTGALFGGSFAIMVCYNGTQLVLGYFLDAVEMGVLGAVSKMLRSLGSLINPFTQTLFPELCILRLRNTGEAAAIFRWSLGLAFLGATACSILVWLMAPWIIRLALGSGYDNAIPVLRIYVIALPFMIMNNIIINQGLVPFGKESQQAVIQGTCAILSLPVAAFAGRTWGLTGGSWLPAIMESGTMFFLLAASLRAYASARKYGASEFSALWIFGEDNRENNCRRQ